jgi:integral membrane sensor domain MASE1
MTDAPQSAAAAERFTAYDILALAGVALAYFLAGRLGLTFAAVHASASPVWPPTGIAIAALVLLGYRAWPRSSPAPSW